MKTIIITGATGSMGREAVKVKASEGYRVIMACRNVKKGEALKQDILAVCPDANLEVSLLDLSSRTSICQFAERMKTEPLVALFNNAGTMAHDYCLTEDGVEMDMATNFLGNALLSRLIVPLLPDGGHLVNMVSLSTRFVHVRKDWKEQGPDTFSQLGTYARSKRALLFFSIALAQRYPRLHIHVSDPGIVDSNMITMGRWFDPLADLFFRPFIKTPKQGVAPALQALKSEGPIRYFVGKKDSPIPRKLTQSSMVDYLWNQTTELFGL